MALSEAGTVQWALGIVVGMLTLALGWLWTRVEGLDGRLNTRIAESARTSATDTAAGDRDLWSAVNNERQRAEDHRVKMLERVAGLVTKEDLAAMEERLSKRIDRHP